MPQLFNKETVISAGTRQDSAKLAEINSHQLLKKEEADGGQVATFDTVKQLGAWFLNQRFNAVLPSSKPLPAGLFKEQLIKNESFLGKIAFGADAESQYPFTAEVVKTAQGYDLRLQIVPIHFGALEVAQFGRHTDDLLALAAAAAVAPQFLMSLEDGIETTHCDTKKQSVNSITPDHGTPLAVTFDLFDSSTQTLDSAIGVTGNRDLSIQQAAHLHGQNRANSQRISKSASGSKIAAGVAPKIAYRSTLPKHLLYVSVTSDQVTGAQKIASMYESLLNAGVGTENLSFLAAILGFTAQVVGKSAREQTIEKVLSPSFSGTPLRKLDRA